MERSASLVLSLALPLALSLAGCGAAPPRAAVASHEAGLPVVAGARLYFDSADPRAPHEMTVAIVDSSSSLSYELACGHVEPARALASPTTGIVDASTLADGRDVYDIGHCDRPTTHDDGAALPAFLVSQHTLAALGHHERTLLRVAQHGSAVALLPVGHESLTVRVDGRPTSVDTIHARGDGVELWVADAGTPIVVRQIDHDRGFTLAGIDTGR